MNPGPDLIGDQTTVTIDRQIDAFKNLIKYECHNLEYISSNWTVYLTSPESETHKNGETVTGWVFDVNTNKKEIIVTTSDRGRADLYNLRDKHREAANHVAQLATRQSISISSIDKELVSHAKGLLTRCMAKNQSDWYTVFALLKKPPYSELRRGQQNLAELRTAVENDDIATAKDKIRTLDRLGISSRFAEFVRAIDHGEEFQSVEDEYLLKKMRRLDGDEFERFLADIWSEMGFEVELNSDDAGGGDIIAKKPQMDLRIEIEAKKRNQNNKLTLSDVQDYQLMTGRKEADRVLLVTNGRFTRPAEREEKRNSFTLMDGEDLLNLIHSENLYKVVKNHL